MYVTIYDTLLKQFDLINILLLYAAEAKRSRFTKNAGTTLREMSISSSFHASSLEPQIPNFALLSLRS